jgi:hypothetical protein
VPEALDVKQGERKNIRATGKKAEKTVTLTYVETAIRSVCWPASALLPLNGVDVGQTSLPGMQVCISAPKFDSGRRTDLFRFQS